MENLESRFLTARKEYIASQFRKLNPMQQQAVMTTQGPLLLLAGAGSGKTTVLINRIANLIRFGCGSDSNDVPEGITQEDVAFLEFFPEEPTEQETRRADRLCALEPAAPWSIMAITFDEPNRLHTLHCQGTCSSCRFLRASRDDRKSALEGARPMP